MGGHGLVPEVKVPEGEGDLCGVSHPAAVTKVG